MSSNERRLFDPEGLNTATWPEISGNPITPVDHFFTRSHAPAPAIDPATWRLEVGGLVQQPRTFSLRELQDTFPQRTVTATLVCAGLRREELLAARPIPGELPWGLEPASTGSWSGIALADVLAAVGIAEGARHVEFIGLDEVERHGHHFGFGASIDLAKAQGPEVLLATHLNGAPLPVPHGFPLRAVVPGWIGARSVKWLGRINLTAQPSENYFQTQAYRFLREPNPQDPRDVTAGTALTTIILNALIAHPKANQVLPAGPVQVQGWAIGTEGQPLKSIELSHDNGQTWQQPQVVAEGGPWAWTFWQANLNLNPGRHILVVRATDSGGASQPRDVAETWNAKGYANNAWHRVEVVVE